MASIRKRGESYEITVSVGYSVNGKKLRQTTTWRPDPARTEKQNAKALQAAAAEFERRVQSGLYLDGEKITVKEFAERWMKDYAQTRLTPASIDFYRHMLQDFIVPAIGHMRLAKVQPVHLLRLYADLQKRTQKNGRPYTAATIRHVHAAASSLFSSAVRWNAITDNPCLRVEPPRDTKPESIKHFSPDEVGIFLTALDEQRVSTQNRLFFYLALFGGLRRGEIVALRWSDLDNARGIVSISKSTTIVSGKTVTGAPKTRSSIRDVALPEDVMKLARRHHLEQLQLMADIGDQWVGPRGKKAYIFTQWNGRQLYPSSPLTAFRKVLTRHNAAHPDRPLPMITLHGLRHTSATLLISQSLDVRSVSARLGHAQTSTTLNIYAHAIKSKDQQAADILGGYLHADTSNME